jgi:isopentenyl-diphosphate delta-isomerase
MDELILVDGDDCEIGHKEKVACHIGDGILHRAFSVFIFNSNGELLIQKRAKGKMLWGGFWSNSCCSHPRRGEDIMDAASRRLSEELGISCGLRYIYKFMYSAVFQKSDSGEFENVGSEREVCSVFIGECSDRVVFDDDEISEIKWVGVSDLIEDVSLNKGKYTPWFLKEIEELRKRGDI